MIITSIKQQVKRTDRYSVFIDGKYSFSLSESELLKQGLKINQELNEEGLQSLQNDAAKDKAYYRALSQVYRRPRSQWELRDYLLRKGYEGEIIDSTINRLQERGYVNDADFARCWVENRRLLKPVSRRRLIQELKQKRVADEHIEAALSEDETDEREVLKELVWRKRQQARYQDELKLKQYLARQGFSYENISAVINETD